MFKVCKYKQRATHVRIGKSRKKYIEDGRKSPKPKEQNINKILLMT